MHGLTLGTVMGAGVALSATVARAEEPGVSSEPASESQRRPATEAKVGSQRSLLPLPKRMLLDWPIRPLSLSFRGWDAGRHATGLLPAFEARAVWLEAGPLSLATTASSLPALELNCRLTCSPMLERALGLEVRAALYSGTLAQNVHGFVTYEKRWGGATGVDRPSLSRKGDLLEVGVAGLLDF